MGIALATYVYCLIAGRVRPKTRVAPGLAGTGPVRLIDVAGQGRGLKTWLAVTDAPLALYGEDAINRHLSDLDWVSRAAVAHEAVVESFIEQPAVLPMKLFTIFTNDARALSHLQSERRRVDSLIARVAGQHEWGVRVTLDLKAQKRGPAVFRSGVDYLSAKKRHRDRSAELVKNARETIAELYDRLEDRAAGAKRRAASELPVQGGPLLMDAAFLVPRSRSASFRALVARQSNALAAQGYHVTLSGPWPPYSFVQD